MNASNRTPKQQAEERFPDSAAFTARKGNVHRRSGFATCIREEVEPREAEVERLRALVQRFVDHNAKWLGKGCLEADIQWDAIISDCQEQGFVPTNTTEG